MQDNFRKKTKFKELIKNLNSPMLILEKDNTPGNQELVGYLLYVFHFIDVQILEMPHTQYSPLTSKKKDYDI